MSEVKVNKITPTAACGTVTLGDSGDTFSIPSGVTLDLQGSSSGILDIQWDTTAKTSAFTAVAGNGYFVNTTSAAITVTLPATPSAGDFVAVKDYANTADTNNITIARNGSNIQGTANDFVISTEGLSIVLIYVDATQGWVSTGAAKASDIAELQLFVTATGGTVTTCGDYKVHTFTSPGTFCVSCAGNAAGSNSVDYLVVAGGGANSRLDRAAGGGAGGFRLSNGYSLPAPTTSPLASPTGLSVSATGYPITVGAGGAGGPGQAANTCVGKGSNSVFSTITSAGGGSGGGVCNAGGGQSGGSGGGGQACGPAGSGNTPPVSPPQGNNGGTGIGSVPLASGGGGGAGAVGGNGTAPAGGNGGVGSYVSPSFAGSNGTTGPVGSTRYFSGGGGGAAYNNSASGGAGGSGGGGAGANATGPDTGAEGNDGTANTGGGAGGSSGVSGSRRSGGSGIVIIRYKFQ